MTSTLYPMCAISDKAQFRMMISELSPFMKDMMALWPLWAVIGTGLLALMGYAFKSWVKLNIQQPIGEINQRSANMEHKQLSMSRIQADISRGLISTATRVENIAVETTAGTHLLKYHLGPNGDTKPVHKRIEDLEVVLGVPHSSPTEWPGSMPWKEKNPPLELPFPESIIDLVESTETET